MRSGTKNGNTATIRREIRNLLLKIELVQPGSCRAWFCDGQEENIDGVPSIQTAEGNCRARDARVQAWRASLRDQRSENREPSRRLRSRSARLARPINRRQKRTRSISAGRRPRSVAARRRGTKSREGPRAGGPRSSYPKRCSRGRLQHRPRHLHRPPRPPSGRLGARGRWASIGWSPINSTDHQSALLSSNSLCTRWESQALNPFAAAVVSRSAVEIARPVASR